jgi:hypothetical protein
VPGWPRYLFRLWWLAALIASAALVVIIADSSSPRPRQLGPLAAARAQLRFKPIDGGPHYFADRSPKSAWMDTRILLGAWLEQPESLTDVRRDSAMGDNIYWNLSGGSVEYNVIREGGMHVSAPSADANTGSETVSWNGDDEPDMNLGPGDGPVRITGAWPNLSETCAGAGCGYTDADWYYSDNASNVSGDTSLPYKPDGRVVHTGYGKGVLFWESAQQSAQFLRYSAVLSADSYWLTDNDLQTASQGGCGLKPRDPTACRGGGGTGLDYTQAHLPANYAFNVTRLESLEAHDGGSKPILVDVETGCPFAGGDNAGSCATPPQTIAAAWHALIAGARGIIWFQHNFSGPCIDFRTFLDGSNPASGKYNCQQTPGVTLHDLVEDIGRFNHEVASLNGVLLSPTATNYVHTGADVSVLGKAYRGSCYVLAAAGTPAMPPDPDQTAEFTVAGHYSGLVQVVDEHRGLRAQRGRFEDRFANANTVHIYKVPDSSLCSTA